MPHLISFLIICVGLLTGSLGHYVPNPLLHLGILVVMAYLFSRTADFLGLPAFLGYILAGMIAGHDGFGFVHEKFLDNMSLIEGLCVMIIVSHIVRFMLKGTLLPRFFKFFALGIISSLASMLLTIVFLVPVSIPLQVKIIGGLFASTFSPLLCHFFTEHEESPKPYPAIAFGGFICSLVLWGIMIPFWDTALPHRLKLALMPIIIGITSISVGFAWGFLSEKLFYRKSGILKDLFPLAVMFLIYPCCGEIGLDYLFVAIGVGVYYGIISEQTETMYKNSELVSLIVFGLFGTRLSLTGAVLLDITNWIFVTLLILCIVLTRIITVKLTMKLLGSESVNSISTIYLIPYGPLAVIIIMRFLPGFSNVLEGDYNRYTVSSIMTTSCILSLIFGIFFNLFTKIMNRKPVMEIDNS